MKTIMKPEDENELENILRNEDVILNISVQGSIKYSLSGNNDYSAGLLSQEDILAMICNVLASDGIIVKIK
jgi:hypothetical protein